jgi:HTH-type transcriptional regulator/antitoxin HigA
MSRTLANPTEMIRLGAPRVIHSDEDLVAYTEALFELTAKVNLTPEDEEAIELLTVLIDRYESKHYPVPAAEPIDVLRFLLDQNGLSQRDISEEVGGESTVSLILSGKRQLNRDHIARLSDRFNVSPAVFFSTDSSRQGKGDYVSRKRSSTRASEVFPTQAKAIERARKINPDATILVEPARNRRGSHKHKRRKQ